jgi:hypothetical protein
MKQYLIKENLFVENHIVNDNEINFYTYKGNVNSYYFFTITLNLINYSAQ